MRINLKEINFIIKLQIQKKRENNKLGSYRHPWHHFMITRIFSFYFFIYKIINLEINFRIIKVEKNNTNNNSRAPG